MCFYMYVSMHMSYLHAHTQAEMFAIMDSQKVVEKILSHYILIYVYTQRDILNSKQMYNFNFF